MSDPTLNVFGTQVTSAGIVVYLIQWLKRSKWFPWLDKKSETLNHAAAAIGAFVSAVGIHMVFNSSEGTLVITGLTLSGIVTAAWDWLQQYVAQRLIYDTVKPKEKR